MKLFFWTLRYPHRWLQYYLFKMSRKQDAENSLSSGFAWGVAISFTPLLGLHILLTIIACKFHRKNIWSGIIGTLIGNPFTFPFIWLFVYWFGLMLFGGKYHGNISDLNNFSQLGISFRSAVFNHDLDNFWYISSRFIHDILPLLKVMMLSSLILFLPIWFLANHIVYTILVSIRAKKKVNSIHKRHKLEIKIKNKQDKE